MTYTQKESEKNKAYYFGIPVNYLNSTHNVFYELQRSYVNEYRYNPVDVKDFAVKQINKELRPIFELRALQLETELRKIESFKNK